MKLESNWWSKLKYIINVIRELRKNSYPLTTKGVKLMLGSILATPSIGLLIHLMFPEGWVISSIDFSASDVSFITTTLGILTWIIGAGLIIIEVSLVKSSARKTAKILITGLPGTSNDFPSEVLTQAEKFDARETVFLSVNEIDGLDHAKQIAMYNSELTVDLFKRFILHQDCQKIYIGGLTRIPFLVAYGAFLRNVSAKISYFDKFHRDASWKILNQEDKDITFSNFHLEKQPNDTGDLGIAVGFSGIIETKQLPNKLQNCTTILKANTETSRNLIQNQENLQRISETVRDIIEELSSVPDCKQVHLFLSVQSTLAIEIGRRFQEGTQRNWVIHNFNFQKAKYEWAIELSKEGIKSFTYDK